MSSSAARIYDRAAFILGGVVSALLVLSVGACFDEPEEPAGPETDSQEAMQASSQRSLVPVEHRRFPNSDEKRALFAEEHPGFAGIYREPDRGNLVVQVTAEADGPAMVDAIRASSLFRRLAARARGRDRDRAA